MYALLIADDADNSAIFAAILQRAGLAVTATKDMVQALQNWPDRPADIILIALPDQDQEELVRRVRAETIVPLILVTRTLDENLHYDLLKHGADLVLAPPVSGKLLVAQVGVLLRRSSGVPSFSLPSLSTAQITLNPETRTVEVTGKAPQRLTHLEFRLLYTLMMNQGRIIPTDTIVERVWGYTGQGDRDLIRGLISRLRSKIEVDPREPQYILTHSGLGYSFKQVD
jgi:DNA-binding response OmpR family regulator